MGFVDFACNEAVDDELLLHELMLHRLRVHFGIRGKTPDWFTSYRDLGADSLSFSVIHSVREGACLST